ncbi:MAG: IS110 family transposase [Acidobacteria bacterium]|nr:IS110 family transposase [Acidobacteriota bacterium]
MSFLPPRAAGDTALRWIGLDLAKRESQLVTLNADGQQIAALRFPTTRENIQLLRAELTEFDTIALEVTTNSNAITRLLQQSPAKILTSNPIRTKMIASAKIKTDKIDARVLAELARAGYLPLVWLPDPDTEALRHLFSDRRSLVDRRTELKNTVPSILHRNLLAYEFEDLFGTGGRQWLEQLCEATDEQCDRLDRLRLRAILIELDRLEQHLQEVEGVIAAIVVERPHVRKQLDRLLSIPGVSLVVGAGLLAAIGDIKRFSYAKQLGSYFGLVPSTYQSGDTKARHGRITKTGRSDARWLAVEAAEHLRKAPGPLRALFQRVSQKRGHNVAVVAVARKLAELVWHLLTKAEDFLYQKPKRTQDKRSPVRLMARRRTGRKTPSAEPPLAKRPALYGSGLKGKKVKADIARLAAEQSEAIYQAIVEHRQEGKDARPLSHPLGFDPMHPISADWQRVLEKVGEHYAELLARVPQPSITD